MGSTAVFVNGARVQASMNRDSKDYKRCASRRKPFQAPQPERMKPMEVTTGISTCQSLRSHSSRRSPVPSERCRNAFDPGVSTIASDNKKPRVHPQWVVVIPQMVVRAIADQCHSMISDPDNKEARVFNSAPVRYRRQHHSKRPKRAR
jgi:hypothetical protein